MWATAYSTISWSLSPLTCPYVTSLNVRGALAQPQLLAACSRIEELNAHNPAPSFFTAHIPPPSLKDLSIFGPQVPHAWFAQLCNLTNLRTVALPLSLVTENLRELGFEWGPLVAERGLLALCTLLDQCPNLRTFYAVDVLPLSSFSVADLETVALCAQSSGVTDLVVSIRVRREPPQCTVLRSVYLGSTFE